MGRLTGPGIILPRRPSGPASAKLCLALAALALMQAAALPAASQNLAERITRQSGDAKTAGKDRLLVHADEMLFDRNKNTVAARGNAQLYYQGRVLQADRVLYDRNNNKVYAEGHAKMTERDGTVAYAERFELTDNFKDGFIDSLRTDTADRTHLSAPRAERTGGDVTTLDRGTYSACEACKDDPSKPPLWQVRAKRIIHNDTEQMVYFEDAAFELMGVPIAWLPYFSVADPNVLRKSGILTPHVSFNSALGAGVSIPVFWALAPNYDLTVTPSFYSRQGFFGQAEWRHQLVNGSYNIRAAGVFQNDPDAFAAPPYGSGNKRARGSLESWGLFYINERWRVGWDLSLVSDKWFQSDYRLPTDNLSSNYFREATSTIYMTGKGDQGFLDLRAYYFKGLSRVDLQDQQPIVAPVLDYHKVIPVKPEWSFGIGGQFEIDGNFLNLSRNLAAYQSTGPRTLDNQYGLYDVCTVYNSKNCLVRGIGGTYTRGTLNLSWKRQIIDPIGQVWTPFVFAHVNGTLLSLDQSRAASFTAPAANPQLPNSIIPNGAQANFFGTQSNAWRGSAVPGAGLEYRYPFVMNTGTVTHVFEPIAQIVVRPNEPVSQSLVNEDAQSLVFDDTNLFQWNKYSGYDRFEGGTRFNYGAQYTMTFQNGGYFNAMAGQSRQIAGRNSYASADAANVGLSSGLDTRRSDIVTRFSIAPNSKFAVIAKARFDQADFSLRRLDVMASAKFGDLDATLQYARYDAQPLLGFSKRREGLSAALKYKFDQHYFVSSNVIFDLSRHLYNNSPGVVGTAGVLSVAGMGFGLGYMDDCTTFSINYTSTYLDRGAGYPVRNQTVLLQLQLRTLGDTRVQSSLGDIRIQDGLNGSTR